MSGKETFDKARSLLGKRVQVSLTHVEVIEGTTEVKPAVITVGTLLAFGDGGDFEILEDDGFVHFCWPLLDIEEIKEEADG